MFAQMSNMVVSCKHKRSRYGSHFLNFLIVPGFGVSPLLWLFQNFFLFVVETTPISNDYLKLKKTRFRLTNSYFASQKFMIDGDVRLDVLFFELSPTNVAEVKVN